MRYAEIARILGITEAAVRYFEKQGLKRMRKHLEKKGLSLSDILSDVEIPEQLPRPVLNCLPSELASVMAQEA